MRLNHDPVAVCSLYILCHLLSSFLFLSRCRQETDHFLMSSCLCLSSLTKKKDHGTFLLAQTDSDLDLYPQVKIVFLGIWCQQKEPNTKHFLHTWLRFTALLTHDSLSLFVQASPWYYYKKRYSPSHGSDGKPRSRIHNVQLTPLVGHEDDECEEGVRLLDHMSH